MSDFRPLCPPPPFEQCSKIMSEIVVCSGGHLTTLNHLCDSMAMLAQWAKITHFGSSRDS